MITRIISGGQTGVDRAGLDAAIELGLPHGGWCPRGRRAEDGRIPDRYQLVELDSPDWMPRTRKNVDEADATLLLSHQWPLTGGTLRTWEYARQRACAGKERFTVNLGDDPADATRWIGMFPHPIILNIAGPRESRCPGIHAAAVAFLLEVLRPFGRVAP